MTDVDTLIREHRKKQDAAATDAIVAAVGRLDERTITREYDLAEPLDIVLPGAHGATRLTRIRVSITTMPEAEPGTEDAEPFYEARAYGRPLTKAGKLDARADGNWYYVPDLLSRRLLAGEGIA